MQNQNILVNHLFESIVQDGFVNGLQSDTYWKQGLDRRYHRFSGNFHKLDTECHKPYRLEADGCEISLKLPVPPTTQQPLFFNKDGYAKHLIGNAFSVPVVTMLLQPLKQLYPTRKYHGYDYQYHWI